MWKYTEAEELSTPLENVDDVWINYDTDVLKGWSFSCNKTSSLSFVPSCLTPVLISPFWTVCRARPKWIFMQFPNHTFGEKKLHFLIVCVEMMEVFWGEKVYAETNGSEENIIKVISYQITFSLTATGCFFEHPDFLSLYCSREENIIAFLLALIIQQYMVNDILTVQHISVGALCPPEKIVL